MCHVPPLIQGRINLAKWFFCSCDIVNHIKEKFSYLTHFEWNMWINWKHMMFHLSLSWWGFNTWMCHGLRFKLWRHNFYELLYIRVESLQIFLGSDDVQCDDLIRLLGPLRCQSSNRRNSKYFGHELSAMLRSSSFTSRPIVNWIALRIRSYFTSWYWRRLNIALVWYRYSLFM